MIVEHSCTCRRWRAAKSGSLAVRLWGRGVQLPGQIARGSRLLGLLLVEDHLAQDRTPLFVLIESSKGIRFLVDAIRRMYGRVLRLAEGDIRAYRNSRLYGFMTGSGNYLRRLSAIHFLVLFLVLFSLVRLALSALGPNISWLAPWSAGPVIAVLAAALIAASQGRFRQRNGLIWTIVTAAGWCGRLAGFLFKRVRRALLRVIFERGNPPVEGGPGA